MAETILEGVLYIPTPIITDILARLPPKAVIRCRCVCKAWLKLISKPEFVNLHLSKSPTTLILFNLISTSPDSASFSLVEVDDETDHHGVPHIAIKDREIPFSHGHNNQMSLIGSIDGLVCIHEFTREPHRYCDLIHIYNPTLKEFITVQPPPGGKNADTYGFGISSGKYVVVRIYREIGKVYLCHVYTIGGGVWKSIGHAPYQFYNDGNSINGFFFNGNFHWAFGECQETIQCLDLRKEVFEPFPAPPELCRYKISTLNIYKGCLSVCNSTSDIDLVIWVMKEYGVGNSWSKVMVINKYVIPEFYQHNDNYVNIIKVFNDGQILLLWSWDETLYSYDPKRKTMQDVGNKYHSTIVDEATNYVPSIVSLKSLGEVNIYRN